MGDSLIAACGKTDSTRYTVIPEKTWEVLTRGKNMNATGTFLNFIATQVAKWEGRR